MRKILSISDVQAGPCLVTVCQRLLSSCGMRLHSSCSEDPLYLRWDGYSLTVICILLSSCDMGTPFSCDSAMVWFLSSSNVQGGFCLVVMCGWLNNLWHGALL